MKLSKIGKLNWKNILDIDIRKKIRNKQIDIGGKFKIFKVTVYVIVIFRNKNNEKFGTTILNWGRSEYGHGSIFLRVSQNPT